MHGHRGYSALFRIDAETLRAEAEPLVHAPGYDVSGRLVFDRAAGALLGVHYETDAPATTWFHPTLKAWQADIDAKLPGTANRIECQRCLHASHLIVTALSDQRPPVYLLYRTATSQLQVLAGQRPDLPVAAMGQRDYHRFKARDGLEIPVLVTQPASGDPKRSPTVVLVHGGPFVRGTQWSWEPTAQFLASRGYLVLEPEFRGSRGFATSSTVRAGSNGVCACRTIWPTPWPGPCARAGPTPRAPASRAPAMGVMRR